MKRLILYHFVLFFSQMSLACAALSFYNAETSSDSSGNKSTAQGGDPVVRDVGLSAGLKSKGAAAQATKSFLNGRFDEAVKLAKPLVNRGNADALYLMGFAHETGQGVDASREKALDFYRRAEKKSHADAPLRIALILLGSNNYQEREDARIILEETAQKDAQVAGRILGEAWLKGLLSDEPDPDQACKWWQRAASSGDLQSLRLLASFYEGQLGFSEYKDSEKAMKLYGEAADAGDIGAMASLGSRLLNGEEQFRDELRGLEWLSKAADAGAATANFVLGDYQERVKQDDKQALASYQRGADAGQLECMVRVAQFYLGGRGVKQDKTKAQSIFKEAAQKGSTEAQFELAMTLLSGENPDLAGGYLNLLSAANGKLIPAQNELGLLYLSGKMGVADPAAAVVWLTRAAKAGNAAAQNNLATLYESGAAGLRRNLQNAHELYTLAADQGHTEATLALVRLSVEGSGHKQDLPKAWAQASLIAESGHEGAVKLTKQITDRLDKDQLQKAKKLLKKYKSTTDKPGN